MIPDHHSPGADEVGAVLPGEVFDADDGGHEERCRLSVALNPTAVG